MPSPAVCVYASQDPARLLLGLRSFSAANYYATPDPGGEAGIATGFGDFVMFVPRSVTSAAARMLTTRAIPGGATSGYQLYISAAGLVTAALSNGTGYVSAPTYQITASDIGRVMVALLYYDGTTIRLWVSRVQWGAGTASAFVPASAPSYIGALATSFPATSTDIISELSFRGTLTDAQIQAVFDSARTFGDLPLTVAGATASHRTSVRNALINTPAAVNGQTGPASIVDTVTGATADLKTRVGTPTIVEIDPKIDGRKAYGVQGASSANYLKTAGGIQGDTNGFWWAYYGTLYAGASAFRQFLGKNLAASTGWYAWDNGAQANFAWNAADGGGVSRNSTAWTIPTSLFGTQQLFVGVHTGSVLRFYALGAQQGADAACVGFTPDTSAPFTIHARGDTLTPQDAAAFFGAAGGIGVPTLAQVQQLFVDVERTGRIQPITGLTDHLYDPTRDVIANGGPTAGVPATVLDRVSTDHLSRVGGHVVDAGGLRGFDTTHTFSTAGGGGVRGAAAGFWIECLATKRAIVAGEVNILVSNYDGTNGYYVQLYNGAAFLAIRGTTLLGVQTSTLSDGVHHVGVIYDGSLAKIYVDGTLAATSSSFTFVPAAATTATVLGNSAPGLNGTTYSTNYGASGGLFVPTAAEMATAAAAALAAGKVVGIPGKTDRRWSLVDDVLDTGGAVPSLGRDRQSSGDDMARIGSPLTVAQRVDRLYSCEVTPILRGVQTPSVSDYFTTAGVSASAFSAATGGSLSLLMRVDGQVTSVTRVLASTVGNGVNNNGMYIQTSGANNFLNFVAFNAAGTGVTSPSYTIPASMIGRVMHVSAVYDVGTSKIRLYVNGVEQGTGTAIVGFSPGLGTLQLLRHGLPGTPALNLTIFGACAGTTPPAPAEIKAQTDACMASEDIVAIPGRSSFLVSVTRDAIANGGVIPTQLTDRIGTDHMSKQGSPVLDSMFARAWAA